MPYHITSSSTSKSTTNSVGKSAPAGYHYMPDGTLMSDIEHAMLHGTRTITDIKMDFNNIKAVGESRRFTVLGDEGAVFSLEIKNEDNSYYNFQTGLFQAAITRLSNVSISGSSYSGNIVFPTVTDADQYDIFLFAESIYNTKHATVNEVRFPDNSFDANSSTGSNSNLVQKVIYQTLDVDITVSGDSAIGTITSFSQSNQTITTSRGKAVAQIPFSINVSVAAGALSIDRQPTEEDLLASVNRTIGAAPVNIPGEDIYPAVTDTDIVNGDFGAENTNKFVMDNNVADKMAVGDRVTTAVGTMIVNGSFNFASFGGKVVMTSAVAARTAVGDRVTISAYTPSKIKAFFNANVIAVTALNPDGDNANEFQMGNTFIFSGISGSLNDGATLEFSSKLNRDVITVAALNPDTDNAKEFSVQDANGDAINVGIRDNATLSFSNQKNYRWTIDNIDGIIEGMSVKDSGVFGSATTIKEYLTETTVYEGEANEYKFDSVRVPSLDTLGAEPVITKNATTNVITTVQSANITFSNQALLSFAGDTVTIFGYGASELKRLTGYDIEINDLKAELNEVTTTTTAAVNPANTTIPVTSKVGIVDKTTQTVNGAITDSKYVVLDSVDGLGIGQRLYAVSAGTLAGTPAITSINETTKAIILSTSQTFADGITLTFPNSVISGIGISNTAVNPYVDTISSLNLTASVAQTLENGQTLTFTGAGNIVTITGNIKVNNVGNEAVTLKLDIDKFLTQH